MPLYLVSSNRVETLQQELTQRLLSEPLADPFAPELIIVPGMAMARWISLQLAQHSGIAANVDYRLPAAWIWQLTADLLPGVPSQDPLARDTAAWKIFRRLPGLLGQEEFAALRRYLADDGAGIKRWQLATRIADLFDRYQFYRPEWIRRWSRGESSSEQPWQAVLWRDLVAAQPGEHRVALLDRLQAELRKGRLQSEQAVEFTIPARVSCFVLSSLPPLYVEVLQNLSAHTDITLYQHSPTDQYWADLKGKKTLSRLRIEHPDEAQYFETGNDLLASWGRQGQAFQDLLLSQDALDAAQLESYQDPGQTSLLHRLQHDIFLLREEPEKVAPDDSIQIAVCHSAMRECQVLHDELLRTLQHDPQLQPEDILVMVPQISRYAPYIEAVFSPVEEHRPNIPWNLSDITLADEHPLIRIFLQLLELPASRFTFSDVMSFLEVPEIAMKFGLNQDACDTINEILQDCRVHWGLDGTHKEALGLPAIEENTWRYVEQRLLAAYAFGNDASACEETAGSGYWKDIAPAAGIEGGTARQIGSFCLLLERLRYWRIALERERSAREWQSLLNALLDELFLVQRGEDDRLPQVREAIDDLQQQAGEQLLSRDLVTECLQKALGEQSIRGRFFSGGVTFCGMRPMRSLPFKVICLLGMNDADFPRREQPVEFDLMAQQWRPGDPRKGDEDRYLLLETILCARQKLYISYTGRSLKDNSVCQPSVLLRQLLDFINGQYFPTTQAGPMSEMITQYHAMQPFSAGNFLSSNRRRSFDYYWCQVARQMRLEPGQMPLAAWPDPVLAPPLSVDADPEQPDAINLARMQRFLGEPVKYFFNYRLRIFLQDDDAVDDEECFALDGLQGWHLQARLASDWLRGLETPQERLRAEGLLPHGSFAAPAFDGIQNKCRGLLTKLEDYRLQSREIRAVTLSLPHGQLLHGQIQYYPGKGLLHYSPSRFKGKALLAAWVEHLALCALPVTGTPVGGGTGNGHDSHGGWRGFRPGEESLLVASDRAVRLRPVEPDNAVWQLQTYANLYKEGMQRPLPAFPGASYAYAVCMKDGDENKARNAARDAWKGGFRSASKADQSDAYVQLVRRGLSGDPLDEPLFTETSRLLYAMALEHMEDVV